MAEFVYKDKGVGTVTLDSTLKERLLEKTVEAKNKKITDLYDNKKKLEAEVEALKKEVEELRGRATENKGGGKTVRFRRNLSGSTIVFQDGKMIVDGKVMEFDDDGQKMGYVDDVHITGSVQVVKTMSGCVTVEGDVTRASSMSGSVTVKGKCTRASSMSGSVIHG